jgi:hypothetical protein
MKSVCSSSPCSQFFFIICLMMNSWSVVLLFGRKPHWYSPIILSVTFFYPVVNYASQNLMSCIQQCYTPIIFTFQFVSFLYIGQMIPSFQLSGIFSVSHCSNQFIHSI